jgi:hypothetical protein
MHDNRFPNLRWIGRDGLGDGGGRLPIADHVEEMLRRVTRRVCGATPGVRVAYDLVTKRVGFYYRNPSDGTTAGAWSERVYGDHGEPVNLDAKADMIVRMLSLGRVPRKVKDAWAKNEADREKSEAESAASAVRRERLEAAADKITHRSGKRRVYAAGGS